MKISPTVISPLCYSCWKHPRSGTFLIPSILIIPMTSSRSASFPSQWEIEFFIFPMTLTGSNFSPRLVWNHYISYYPYNLNGIKLLWPVSMGSNFLYYPHDLSGTEFLFSVGVGLDFFYYPYDLDGIELLSAIGKASLDFLLTP